MVMGIYLEFNWFSDLCFTRDLIIHYWLLTTKGWIYLLHQISFHCLVGPVGSVSASRTVGREFASRPGHTKNHHKNGTYA